MIGSRKFLLDLIRATKLNKSKTSKSSKSKNALCLGFYSGDKLLPWEAREDFETILSELFAEFRPQGRMEIEIVFDLAHTRWQKARLRKLWRVAAESELAGILVRFES